MCYPYDEEHLTSGVIPYHIRILRHALVGGGAAVRSASAAHTALVLGWATCDMHMEVSWLRVVLMVVLVCRCHSHLSVPCAPPAA